jgi:hypothetical protein
MQRRIAGTIGTWQTFALEIERKTVKFGLMTFAYCTNVIYFMP